MAKKAKSEKELKDMIKKEYESTLREALKSAVDIIQSYYESAVDAFYLDYDPGTYTRTYNTYYGSDRTIFFGSKTLKKYDLNNNIRIKETENGWIGKAFIRVGDEFLHDYYQDPTDYVFQRTWKKGIHGTTAVAPPMSPSPLNLFKSKLRAFEYQGLRNHLDKYFKKK